VHGVDSTNEVSLTYSNFSVWREVHGCGIFLLHNELDTCSALFAVHGCGQPEASGVTQSQTSLLANERSRQLRFCSFLSDCIRNRSS
jgi:hypothetical protein